MSKGLDKKKEQKKKPEKTLLTLTAEIRSPDPFSEMNDPAVKQPKPMKGVARGETFLIVVKGVVTVYQNKHTKRKQMQIVIDRAGQIILSPNPGLTRPGDVTDPADTSAAL